MASLIISALFLITIFSLQSLFVFAQWIVQPESKSYNLFAGDLLSAIVDQESNNNVVYSPISIHAILGLLYMGAGGSTENELRSVLRLDQNQRKTDFALSYRYFFETPFNKTEREDEYYAPPQLSFANSIYVRKDMQITDLFKTGAHYCFKAELENVDFNDRLAVVQKINHWVEEQTSNKIKNLMKPDAIDESTSMVLVNAIYLSGKWSTPFILKETKKRDFYVNHNEIVTVDTMISVAYFPYVELGELNAKAVELPLQDSDISMLIILPNKIDGLQQLEEKLKGKDLNKIVSNMRYKYLDLFLPKFRIEYEIDLTEPLKKMGCSSMFGDNANLTDIFESKIHHRVSKVMHKVYLDCNEEGLEAAAATYVNLISRLGGKSILFRVDHPFFFAIRSKKAIFFSGHVKNF